MTEVEQMIWDVIEDSETVVVSLNVPQDDAAEPRRKLFISGKKRLIEKLESLLDVLEVPF